MRCGVSTACFFPLPTKESLQALAGAGVKLVEIFFNTFSEMDEEYVDALCAIVRENKMEVSSVHPFSSVLEGFYFASRYASRFEDGERLYRRFYEICGRLGSDKLVFHGDHKYNNNFFSNEEYAEAFVRLAHIGQEYGVALCHENVAYCRMDDSHSVARLRPLFEDSANFVLDTKQAQRRGEDVYKLMHEMAGGVRQVHISDYSHSELCLPPGVGEMDYGRFLEELAAGGYQGDLIIELYSDNFETVDDLIIAKEYIGALLR